jgi:lysophospholipase L1-like esterase
MKKILFFGDSITDCGRDKNNIQSSGTGYPLLVKSYLGFEHPGEYEFVNTGISGNRIVDLYAAIKARFINHKPDYASILIGVNDTWHEINYSNGVDTDKFEKIYSMLIEEIKEALPDIKIIIFEPFVLEGPATTATETCPNKWDDFKADVPTKSAAAKRVAEKYGLKFVPLQKLFDEACKTAPATYWLTDGVHPTNAGHELIKREWLKAFDEIK